MKSIVLRNAAEVAGKTLGEFAIGSALTTSAIPRDRQSLTVVKNAQNRPVCVFYWLSSGALLRNKARKGRNRHL